MAIKEYRNILITGASSGLGLALAEIYAKPGVNLFLCGRDIERLRKATAKISLNGAKLFLEKADVQDTLNMENFIKKSNDVAPLDLVIANAGISETTSIEKKIVNNPVAEVFATNINGVLNTINPAIEFMKQQRSGQIAIISSLAGLRGLPSCPAYSTSKGTVRFYGEALRGVLKDYGVGVSVICPGYIKTPMTDVNDFPMPFIMTPAKAAGIIKAGLSKNKARIAFPKLFYWLVYLAAIFPPAITDPVFSRLPRKKA